MRPLVAYLGRYKIVDWRDGTASLYVLDAGIWKVAPRRDAEPAFLRAKFQPQEEVQ